MASFAQSVVPWVVNRSKATPSMDLCEVSLDLGSEFEILRLDPQRRNHLDLWIKTEIRGEGFQASVLQ